jgi:hypothetical protein
VHGHKIGNERPGRRTACMLASIPSRELRLTITRRNYMAFCSPSVTPRPRNPLRRSSPPHVRPAVQDAGSSLSVMENATWVFFFLQCHTPMMPSRPNTNWVDAAAPIVVAAATNTASAPYAKHLRHRRPNADLLSSPALHAHEYITPNATH